MSIIRWLQLESICERSWKQQVPVLFANDPDFLESNFIFTLTFGKRWRLLVSELAPDFPFWYKVSLGYLTLKCVFFKTSEKPPNDDSKSKPLLLMKQTCISLSIDFLDLIAAYPTVSPDIFGKKYELTGNFKFCSTKKLWNSTYIPLFSYEGVIYNLIVGRKRNFFRNLLNYLTVQFKFCN